jgi:hypothetical protein
MSDEESRPESEPQPLTADDLELLATPTEELEKRINVFSFDEKRFTSRISSGVKWQQLLQAHLYYDHVLARLLSDALQNPDAINVKRLGFAQKLQFISALSLLNPGIISAVGFINNLRIKMAHELDFEIDDKSVRDLENCTPMYLREIILKEDGRKPGPILFYELLRIILLQIEVMRQSNALERLLARKTAIRLRTVAEGTPDVIYRE